MKDKYKVVLVFLFLVLITPFQLGVGIVGTLFLGLGGKFTLKAFKEAEDGIGVFKAFKELFKGEYK